jgi:diamine N-acetyltransferase
LDLSISGTMLISGEKVSLRRAQPADAERAYEWMALSELTPLFVGPPLFPDLPLPTRAAFDELYAPALFDHANPYDGRALLISAARDDVGVLIYSDVRLLAGAVELELWLAEKRFCGHGFGSEALMLACAWLHAELGVDAFALRPSRRNVRALRCARRAGFRSVQTDAELLLDDLGLGAHPLADSELMLLRLPPPAVQLQVNPGRTYVFVDTEFTQLLQPQLISIGAVSTDANAFYCELSCWPREEASAFVVQNVLPLLDGDAVPHATAAQAFAAWLDERATQPLTVVSDSAYDRWALADLLGGESLPIGMNWQRVPLAYEALDSVVASMGLRRHHALDDARGLRQALLNRPV